MVKAKKKAAKKAGRKKKAGAQNAKALELIDGLDSEHQSAVPVLRKLASGQAVTEKELTALGVGDTQTADVVPIIRAIAAGKADAATKKAIASLDSFGEQLQPVLLALVK